MNAKMIINIPTKICFGEENLSCLANEYKKEKVLIVTSKSKRITATDTYKTLIKLFEKNNTDYAEKKEVDEGIKECITNKCTALYSITFFIEFNNEKEKNWLYINENCRFLCRKNKKYKNFYIKNTDNFEIFNYLYS